MGAADSSKDSSSRLTALFCQQQPQSQNREHRAPANSSTCKQSHARQIICRRLSESWPPEGLPGRCAGQLLGQAVCSKVRVPHWWVLQPPPVAGASTGASMQTQLTLQRLRACPGVCQFMHLLASRVGPGPQLGTYRHKLLPPSQCVVSKPIHQLSEQVRALFTNIRHVSLGQPVMCLTWQLSWPSG